MDSREKILRSVAASSAMEGLPLSEDQLETVRKILDGKMTLQDYFDELIARNKEK